jgi:hypothetical protein
LSLLDLLMMGKLVTARVESLGHDGEEWNDRREARTHRLFALARHSPCSATLVTDLSALPATLLSLEAIHAPLTDDTVRQIRARCPALHNLNLSFTPVTDRILPVIGEMMGYGGVSRAADTPVDVHHPLGAWIHSIMNKAWVCFVIGTPLCTGLPMAY